MKKLFIILLSIQLLFAVEVTKLQKGDIIEDSVKHLEKKYYKVYIKDGKDIRVKLTDLDQDVDLYVRTAYIPHYAPSVNNHINIQNQLPTLRKNDCFSSNSNIKDEECRYTVYDSYSPVYIMVYGFKSSSYKLEVTEVEHKRIDILTTNTTRDKVKKGENKQYKVHGKAGETIKVSLFDLTADADLRLKIGTQARKNHFDCKSTKGKRKTDSCSVTLKKDDWVYVHVDGYKSANYSIKKDVIDNDKQLLIDKAKEHCLNKDNSGSRVLCSNEKGIVYILTEKTDYQTNIIYYASYKVSVAKDNESVNLLEKHSEPMWQHPHTSEYFIKKLENTLMYGTVTVTQEADERGSYNFYYKEKSVLSFRYRENDGSLRNIHTSENGNKLHIEYSKDVVQDDAKKCQEVYDISNPAEPKLFTKKCKALYPKLQ